jgi:hypothetical protein
LSSSRSWLRTPEKLAFAERELRKVFEEWFDDEEKESIFERERELTAQGRGEEVARGYWSYQAHCVVAHFFIEDALAQTGQGLLHVFVDDCGNLVRKKRAKPDEVDNFHGAWLEGHWKEGWACDPDGGELGAAYLPRGVRGPPIICSQVGFMQSRASEQATTLYYTNLPNQISRDQIPWN